MLALRFYLADVQRLFLQPVPFQKGASERSAAFDLLRSMFNEANLACMGTRSDAARMISLILVVGLTDCRPHQEGDRRSEASAEASHATAFADDTILIARGNAANFVNVEIQPSNTVVISSYDLPNYRKPARQETLALTSLQANHIRRLLSPFYPPETALLATSGPEGCKLPEAPADWTVVFSGAGPHPKMRLYMLPPKKYCAPGAYEAVDARIRQSIKALPPSALVRSFGL